MSKIEISESAKEKIKLLQQAWVTTESGVIDRLLQSFADRQIVPAPPPPDSQSEVPVHAQYEGTRIEGLFNTQSQSLTITNGELSGRQFKSPSGAAMAMVRHLKPSVHNNRNGWTFWTITANGHPLQTLRPSTPTRNS
ncbi:hypothetical protein AB5J62_03760 [Amycolatopsis sp. cg5]|uniref:hypothetical protein n=1 Tax=Amycolatopsis sp. cg5 TaxID=3238802 RepID=UPI00352573E6